MLVFVRASWNVTSHAQKPDFVFRAKRTSPFKSARWAGRQFSRLLAAEVCAISGSNAGYTMFRVSVKNTVYPLHSPFPPLHFSSRASPCAITFQQESKYRQISREIPNYGVRMRGIVTLVVVSPTIYTKDNMKMHSRTGCHWKMPPFAFEQVRKRHVLIWKTVLSPITVHSQRECNAKVWPLCPTCHVRCQVQF